MLLPPSLTVDLRLPDRVCDAPEPGQEEEDVALVGVGRPHEKDDHDGIVDGGSEEEDGHATDVVDDLAEGKGEEGVVDGVGDEDEAHHLDPIGAGDEALVFGRYVHRLVKQSLKNYLFLSYGSEVRVLESLLQTRPDGDRDDKQLVRVLEVPQGRRHQLEPSQLPFRLRSLRLLLLLLALLDVKPGISTGQKINKKYSENLPPPIFRKKFLRPVLSIFLHSFPPSMRHFKKILELPERERDLCKSLSWNGED